MTEVDKFLSEVPKEEDQQEQTGTDTSSESAAETKPTDTEAAPSEQNKQPEKEVPFHEHPRFKEVIDEKNTLKRQVEELSSFRQKFESLTKEDKLDIPEWFGGDEKQYQKFIADQETLVQKRVDGEFAKARQAQLDTERRVQENTLYIDNELKKLKDEGKEFDKNELFAVVRDFRPLAEDGVHWDFKRAHQILEARRTPTKTGRKALAAATTDTSKDSSAEDIQTPETLKNKGWKFF